MGIRWGVLGAKELVERRISVFGGDDDDDASAHVGEDRSNSTGRMNRPKESLPPASIHTSSFSPVRTQSSLIGRVPEFVNQTRWCLYSP